MWTVQKGWGLDSRLIFCVLFCETPRTYSAVACSPFLFVCVCLFGRGGRAKTEEGEKGPCKYKDDRSPRPVTSAKGLVPNHLHPAPRPAARVQTPGGGTCGHVAPGDAVSLSLPPPPTTSYLPAERREKATVPRICVTGDSRPV